MSTEEREKLDHAYRTVKAVRMREELRNVHELAQRTGKAEDIEKERQLSQQLRELENQEPRFISEKPYVTPLSDGAKEYLNNLSK
jgi:hypothetical protein